MFRQSNLTFAALAVSGLVIIAGCGQQQGATAPGKEASASSAASEQSAKIEAAMAKLSDADRQTAMAQRGCPVTGEALGSMGTPIKVTQGDRRLFVCCAGCEEEAKNKFDEFYAQLIERPQAGKTP